MPLIDAMQVPTYARYLKDILNNKRPLPTTKVVTMKEECSAAILDKLPKNKKDLGCPTITCSIGMHHLDHALCDLGASVSIMPKLVFDQLNFTMLTPTPMQLELANSSVYHPAGIAEDIPVKIWDFFMPVILWCWTWRVTRSHHSFLGGPFLSTTEAHVDVAAGVV